MAPPELSPEDAESQGLERTWVTTKFEQGLPDAEWSSAARRELNRVLDEGGFGSSEIAAVECRTQVCRFTLETTGGANALELIRLGREMHDETWVDYRGEAAERWTIDVFFARPGTSLSALIQGIG